MDSGSSEPCRPSLKYLKSAFMAMEPVRCIVSLARQSGGGSITTEVQMFILEHCVNDSMQPSEGIAQRTIYIKNILKSIITVAESTSSDIVDRLYEEFAYYMTLHMDDDLLREKAKIYKRITFYMPDVPDEICSSSTELVVPLQCSLNMLEGDTGCALWPSSLFLSEFILCYPGIFSNKYCFEVGSGVGLVGISLAYVGASKVSLTDGDTLSLSNMEYNLELNQLTTETKVECKYLLWDAASEGELESYEPDIVLGADVIYNPQCIPHLVRILSILLNPKRSTSNVLEEIESDSKGLVDHKEGDVDCNAQYGLKKAPIAYIATVIRNSETFSYFLRLATAAHLSVDDMTERRKPLNLLPYMLSYDRSAVRLYGISYSCS